MRDGERGVDVDALAPGLGVGADDGVLHGRVAARIISCALLGA